MRSLIAPAPRLGLRQTVVLLAAMLTATAMTDMAQGKDAGVPDQVPHELQECRQEQRKLTNASAEKDKTIARLDNQLRSGNGFALIVAIACVAGGWVLLGFIERVSGRGRLASELAAEKRTTELLTSLLKSRKPAEELLGQIEGILRTSRETKAAQERHAQELSDRLQAQSQNLTGVERRLAQLEKRA